MFFHNREYLHDKCIRILFPLTRKFRVENMDLAGRVPMMGDNKNLEKFFWIYNRRATRLLEMTDFESNSRGGNSGGGRGEATHKY